MLNFRKNKFLLVVAMSATLLSSVVIAQDRSQTGAPEEEVASFKAPPSRRSAPSARMP